LWPKTSNTIFFSDCVLADPFVVASFSQNVESIVLVVDPTQVEANLANNMKRKIKMR
jgi:hypothetical protein